MRIAILSARSLTVWGESMKRLGIGLAALGAGLMLLLTACGSAQTGERAMGELIGLRYNLQIGMVRDEDFYIDICDNEIKSTRIFPLDESATDYLSAENLPLESGKWQELRLMIEELMPQLTPVKGRSDMAARLVSWLARPTDGPNSEEFFLIFEGGEVVQYKIPSDAAFRELISLLRGLSYEAVK